MKYIIVLFIAMQFIELHVSQRVAPGVPPQQYGQHQQVHMPQQQQHAPQYQQAPVQHHVPVHEPMQHQQVPVQHQQAHQPQMAQQPVHQQQVHQQQIHQQQVHQQQVHQQPMQQQQVHHQHGHAHPQQGQLLNTANIAHEKDHIQEHMEIPMDTSKMSEQELQFHYFKMHDADNNNKLDGCELIKSLIHWHEQSGKDRNEPTHEEKIFKDDELIALIDPILGMDDGNHDGYIDYPEFIRAQQKAAASAKN